MNSKDEFLFVYGTLLDCSIQKKVIGRAINGIEDQLHGYTKIYKEFSEGVYPALIEKKDFSVSGMFLTLKYEELKLCDIYEGHEYSRKKVILSSGIKAWVYLPVV